ncbi:uncharacterized protein LOC120130954 [Hibiscus syriacus]|uniref:uncharacterized protein LOC120130954 n=1 Tax=Hibiscus syriacus TaxID=106335 RepID=UPI0019223CF6|nr:uncharacterized protein LOC120130954 [Hibiscus syriacus]
MQWFYMETRSCWRLEIPQYFMLAFNDDHCVMKTDTIDPSLIVACGILPKISPFPNSILFQTKLCSFSSNSISLSSRKTKTLDGTWKLKSAEEGETSVSQQEDPVVAEQQDSVSVPVSPSDTLRMYFQADGMLNEAEIPKVTKALEGAEGVSNLKVQVLEVLALLS